MASNKFFKRKIRNIINDINIRFNIKIDLIDVEIFSTIPFFMYITVRYSSNPIRGRSTIAYKMIATQNENISLSDSVYNSVLKYLRDIKITKIKLEIKKISKVP